MKKTALALTCLALLLLAALILGAGLSVAQTGVPLHDPRPSPTPDGLGPAPAPAAAAPDVPPMPDLVVTSIEVYPSTPIINEPASIQVTIKNQGAVDVPLGNNFYTDLYVDPSVVPIQLFQTGVYSWGVQAYWLPADGSFTLATTLVFTDVRVYALWAQVDTDAQVAEANENNNVLGPVHVQVVAPNTLVQQTHQDFQMGMASNMDLSHPDGVMRRGIFLEPSTEPPTMPHVYRPDAMINDVTGTWTVPYSYTTVNQVKPALTGDGAGKLFAAWEDGRNGGVYNRDIFFAYKDVASTTWGSNVRINSDDTGNQVSPDLAYDATRKRLYVVWQDGRHGPDDYDIYFAYSQDYGNTWQGHQMISRLANGDPSLANQMNPSIAMGPSGAIYVVWQDRRNGNDDIYLARSFDGGTSWNGALDPNLPPENYFVTDDPDMTAQNQVNPSVDVQEDYPLGRDIVYVCWEDWRVAGHPEIYVADSADGGQTFGIDIPVTEPGGASYRVEPSIAVGLFVSATVTETQVFMHDIHVAWQEGQGDEADVYWAYARRTYVPPFFTCPWPRDFCFEAPQKVNGFVIDSRYVQPPDPGPTWPTDPSWQGQVDLALASEYDFTWCHADSTEVYSRGAYIVWSDASSFDSWRYELQTRRVAAQDGYSSYETCEDSSTGVLNDNAKLYPYRDNPDMQVYELYKPAATRQANPSIYRDDTGVYVAWDDDRWDDPLRSGTVRNRDVFFAQMGISADAIYVSPVLDAHAEAQWYVLSWWAATDHYDDLVLQTRFGISGAKSPPHEDVAANGWTKWTGNPSSTYLGCEAGAGCYYDAPGRHIVDPDGKEWIGCSGVNCPESYRYIQYKVIMRYTHSFRTALSQVKIYYKGANRVYLPIVIKNH
jgi:hypothetical protein